MNDALRTMTNNNPGILRKPILFSLLRAFMQGQPYFVILMVMLELLNPLLTPGLSVNYFRLWLYVGWLAAALLLLFLFSRVAYAAESSMAYSVGAEGRLSLGDHLRTLSMGFFKGRDPGDITALMLQDYTNVEMLLSHILLDAISALMLPAVFLIALIPYDWRMALITLVPIPLAIVTAILARVVVYRKGAEQIASKNAASSRMLEYLDGMKNIKSHNLQGKKFTRLKASFERLRKDSIVLEGIAGPAVIIGVWFLNAGIALIMISGISFLLQGTLSVPVFLFFLIIGTRMYDPLSRVMISFAEMSYFSVSLGRITEILKTKALAEPETSEELLQHDIEFENVSFRYHDTDVLQDVSFRLEENSMTALVGPSGSGKTTITRLIARFWDVNQGAIKIGGKPIASYASDELLSKISMVFQDVYLFNDSILANIKVGKADATMDEVIAAAKKARCHEFIEAFDDGYDTMVGEGGATLSGGEKQRISIARAILKNAPIVLLDEATASLDPENEHYIQDAIGELIRGRTLIVIAHRLSTVTKADQILVLENSTLIQNGTHEELLSEVNGLYARMWHEQEKAHSWKLGTNNGSRTAAVGSIRQ
ncbi:ABC transporter ATP-binding protein [Salinispira pacifica]|uniref:Transport ATP-binding protein CydC n=1 Tax=Salinispira pacifica TaxID=1307761 RepID=V5WE30_9SPIO|nr:ABC transporter ATP-binding protein [Salinispira pacifica]AHC14032.1 Transport ATP-binding protein CydC [Salinispira pacifica]